MTKLSKSELQAKLSKLKSLLRRDVDAILLLLDIESHIDALRGELAEAKRPCSQCGGTTWICQSCHHSMLAKLLPPEAIPIMAANERLRSELAAANERTGALREALVRGTDFVAGWMSEAHEAGESERPYILNANLWLKAASAILKDGQP